jgi:AT-rich DNA-binding protein
MKSLGVPIPTLRRLPLYYQQLLLANRNGKNFISSDELGKATGSAPEQVRKDLSFLTGQGKTRVGYDTQKLAAIIEEYLGLLADKEAVLVGAGNLGRALALYPGFAQYGLKITQLFDIDPKKIGGKVGSLPVYAFSQLTERVAQAGIRVGIITSPPHSAQEIADAMLAGGIKAIWNFSMAHIVVPEDVLVRNADLSLELGVISHFLSSLDRTSSDK